MTEPAPEPWPLPNVWRILPADVSDAEYETCMDELRQEIRDTGAAENLIRSGVTAQEDGTYLAQAWQAKSRWSWEWPPPPVV